MDDRKNLNGNVRNVGFLCRWKATCLEVIHSMESTIKIDKQGCFEYSVFIYSVAHSKDQNRRQKIQRSVLRTCSQLATSSKIHTSSHVLHHDDRLPSMTSQDNRCGWCLYLLNDSLEHVVKEMRALCTSLPLLRTK
jgi:hypothetical protein